MTTTTNLSLNQPAYNSSAWDVPLNNNETILDSAFGGTTSISLTNANVTLTGPNTTGTGQTQAMRFRLTGAISANIIITIPSGISGRWIVQNATTGAYTITFASGGGGASLTVQQGYNTSIYCDGTNVYLANDAVVAAANGGTGLISPGTSGNILTSNGTAWVSQAPAAQVAIPSGVVTPYAGSSAPTGWLLCSGGQVSRTTYSDLFTAIGTTYGSGDGSTTFNLPDLRGRSAFGVDNMGGTSANRITSAGSGITGTTLSASGGLQNITLTVNEMPSHTHQVYFGNPYYAGNHVDSATVLNGYQTVGSWPMLPTGGDQPHNNMPPAIILNYIIKT